ncbi:MAG: phage tail tape measure protein [Pseudomonadota bacterium]
MQSQDPFSTGFATNLGAALDDMRSLAAGFTGEISEATEAIRALDSQSQKLSRSLSSSLKSAFDKAVFGGEKLSTVFRDLASSVASKALDAALTPVTNSLASGFAGIFGNVAGSFGGLFADGAAFSSGRVRAFARGGVVDGPTFFPMRGATGLMGEAGPEAIMPLSRGPDGKLGVAAQGGGGAAPIVVNIQTPDAASFERSRGQVSAQLARAVRRGQRGL